MKGRSLIALAVAAIAAAAPAIAVAQDSEADDSDSGAILFARDGAIWRDPVDGGAQEKVIALPVETSTVSRIEVGRNGKYVLVEAGGKTGYAPLVEGQLGKVTPLECDRGAVFSPDGICIACLDASGKILVYPLATGKKRTLSVTASAIGFVSKTRIAAVDTASGEIAAVPIAGKGKREKLAPHVPADHFSVAPGGKRAVGTYVDGDVSALYGFRLDGKAARRKLGGAGLPRGWSADSRWVVIQDDTDVCVVRAVGGEYKCWEGYIGLALSPDGTQVLLTKEKSKGAWELYRAPIAGARPAAPAKIPDIGKVEAPAGAWMR